MLNMMTINKRNILKCNICCFPKRKVSQIKIVQTRKILNEDNILILLENTTVFASLNAAMPIVTDVSLGRSNYYKKEEK